jgi:type VI protein secretion system component Hcp
MAFFLKVGPIKGESKEVQDYINVLDWEMGAELPVSRGGAGSGQVAGQSEVRDLTVTVLPDKSFVDIWKFACNGRPVHEAILLCRKNVAGQPKEYFKVTLNDVYVAAARLTASGEKGADPFHPHQFVLKFDKMRIEYTEYKKDGTPGDKPKAAFDTGKHELS